MTDTASNGHVQPRMVNGCVGLGAHQPYWRPSMSPNTNALSPVVMSRKPGMSNPGPRVLVA